MNLDLTHKNAVVCGSTQGIGKASAIELALSGANITLIARNEDKLKEIIQKLDTTKNQQHSYLVADFSFPDKLKELLDTHFTDISAIHILVNNTGGPAGGAILEASLDEFRITFNNHLICNHILVQKFAPMMKKANYGRIINVISTSVKAPLKGLGVSNTIRAAVANWSKTLAGELAPYGITVNNVLPGATKTIRLETIIENKAKKLSKSITEIEHEMVAEIPAGRFGMAEEIANAVAFLASPAAAYINGINVPVDGGRTVCL